jgi:ElaB/YqjD/DUF883 family membrane-anchored ribosome-binding protein
MSKGHGHEASRGEGTKHPASAERRKAPRAAAADEGAEKPEQRAEGEMKKLGEELRTLGNSIEEKLTRLRSASGKGWDEIKTGIEAAWRDLKEGFERARVKLSESQEQDADSTAEPRGNNRDSEQHPIH